eukprot:CAMPEP_0198120726 /NCGR_PEP_ID=MMETSP1442-20131203/30104_1 /TAXON_ID= /ORGANISM="Craspedostauros australis, Strain CCMP3328" /LENGTH=111 /DNA_ID=CAMNT_0043779429 /DNA_START=179 /DNA_END=516 /DNA_ORIENTATION=-
MTLATVVIRWKEYEEDLDAFRSEPDHESVVDLLLRARHRHGDGYVAHGSCGDAVGDEHEEQTEACGGRCSCGGFIARYIPERAVGTKIVAGAAAATAADVANSAPIAKRRK